MPTGSAASRASSRRPYHLTPNLLGGGRQHWQRGVHRQIARKTLGIAVRMLKCFAVGSRLANTMHHREASKAIIARIVQLSPVPPARQDHPHQRGRPGSGNGASTAPGTRGGRLSAGEAWMREHPRLRLRRACQSSRSGAQHQGRAAVDHVREHPSGMMIPRMGCPSPDKRHVPRPCLIKRCRGRPPRRSHHHRGYDPSAISYMAPSGTSPIQAQVQHGWARESQVEPRDRSRGASHSITSFRISAPKREAMSLWARPASG